MIASWNKGYLAAEKVKELADHRSPRRRVMPKSLNQPFQIALAVVDLLKLAGEIHTAFDYDAMALALPKVLDCRPGASWSWRKVPEPAHGPKPPISLRLAGQAVAQG